MAFVSYTYNGYNGATNQYTYTLVDSEFGAVEVVIEGRGLRVGFGVAAGVAVVIEYSKRGLNVGRNLALLVLYEYEQYGKNIEDIKRWQYMYCREHVENWATYATERDKHLEKLLPIT